MDKKKLLLSLAAITGAVSGGQASSNEFSEQNLEPIFSEENTKKAAKRQFVLKVNMGNWEESEAVSHRSHSSHKSHHSHSSHRSSTFV